MSSSRNDRNNTEVVPEFTSEIFYGNEEKRYELAIFSPDDIMSYQPGSLEEKYLQLRANVYIKQSGFLDKDSMRDDGTELDEYDKYSTHFAMIENRLMGNAALFACARIIPKSVKTGFNLPIEDYFPEAFIEPAQDGDFEISRFIARHSDSSVAYFSKLIIMAAGIAHSEDNELKKMFGVVNPTFSRLLKIMGIPIDEKTKAKLLEKYNDKNVGIEIDQVGAKRTIEKKLGEVAMNSIFVPDRKFVLLDSLVA